MLPAPAGFAGPRGGPPPRPRPPAGGEGGASPSSPSAAPRPPRPAPGADPRPSADAGPGTALPSGSVTSGSTRGFGPGYGPPSPSSPRSCTQPRSRQPTLAMYAPARRINVSHEPSPCSAMWPVSQCSPTYFGSNVFSTERRSSTLPPTDAGPGTVS